MAPLFDDVQRTAEHTTGVDQSLDPATGIDWHQALWSFEPHSNTAFEAFSSGGLALALIAGLVLLARLPWARWVLLPLTGIGSMSLTVYAVSIAILADFQPEGPVADSGLVGWLCLWGVVVCWAWTQFFTAGPLEQVMGAVADRLSGRSRR